MKYFTYPLSGMRKEAGWLDAVKEAPALVRNIGPAVRKIGPALKKIPGAIKGIPGFVRSIGRGGRDAQTAALIKSIDAIKGNVDPSKLVKNVTTVAGKRPPVPATLPSDVLRYMSPSTGTMPVSLVGTNANYYNPRLPFRALGPNDGGAYMHVPTSLKYYGPLGPDEFLVRSKLHGEIYPESLRAIRRRGGPRLFSLKGRALENYLKRRDLERVHQDTAFNRMLFNNPDLARELDFSPRELETAARDFRSLQTHPERLNGFSPVVDNVRRGLFAPHPHWMERQLREGPYLRDRNSFRPLDFSSSLDGVGLKETWHRPITADYLRYANPKKY